MANSSSEFSILGPSTHVVGKVSGAGGLRVEGTVRGDVVVTGSAEITDGASVHGNVEAANLEVAGSLVGDVQAAGPIAVRASATVRGKLAGSQVAIEPGARVAVQLETDVELDLDF